VADALLQLGDGLWNRDRTRLTVILHPGRVKDGIASSPGPVLEEGKRYTLRVAAGWPDGHGRKLSANFDRSFVAGPAVRTALDPAKWQITATPNRIDVRFDRVMDEAVVVRLLALDGVAGVGEATDGGRGWRFTPRQPLAPGDYTLATAEGLEDPCGNRVGRAFEAGPDAAPERSARVRVVVR
jgi:hypothetical protein